MATIYSGSLLPVGVCDRHSCDLSGVTAQEQEGDVAGGGDQVDQHGHADGSQRRQVQLLHQQAAHEDPQACAWNSCHTLKRKLCPNLFIILVNKCVGPCKWALVHVCCEQT